MLFVSHRCLHFFGSFFLSDEFVGSACAVIRWLWGDNLVRCFLDTLLVSRRFWGSFCCQLPINFLFLILKLIFWTENYQWSQNLSLYENLTQIFGSKFEFCQKYQISVWIFWFSHKLGHKNTWYAVHTVPRVIFR